MCLYIPRLKGTTNQDMSGFLFINARLLLSSQSSSDLSFPLSTRQGDMSCCRQAHCLWSLVNQSTIGSLKQRTLMTTSKARCLNYSCLYNKRSTRYFVPTFALPRTTTAEILESRRSYTMATKQSVPMDVALTWKQQDRPFDGATDYQRLTEISLEETVLEERSSEQRSSNHEPDEAADGAIPASILQYQRQLRKAQHASKVSRTLDIHRDLNVVYADEHVVVVNKPPGVLTVPGINHHASVLGLVCEAFPDQHSMEPANRIVHRLDMDTSGLVLFSRSPEVTKRLHASFRNHKVHKTYECLVMGHWGRETESTAADETIPDSNTTDEYIIDLPLQRDHVNPPFMRVSTPRSEAEALSLLSALQQTDGFRHLVRKRPKQSTTRIWVKSYGVWQPPQCSEPTALPYTHLKLEPVTGRTHQLRVHCAAAGYPIVGDPTYTMGGEASPRGGLTNVPTVVYGCPTELQQAWEAAYPVNNAQYPMCLHAATLRLEHPVTNETMEWHARPVFPPLLRG